MTSNTPPLPTFLIIGAQKSATRWLRSNLGKHPDVFTAPEELSFFNTRYRYGPDYYRAQFEGWNGEPIVGEATPGYMMWRHKPPRMARRIHETIPDARLIAILRDPIERANSAMHHHIRRGRLKKRSKLVDVATRMEPTDDRLCVVTGGWYAASLKKYDALFGDQLLVLLHDDIVEDPSWVYRAALEHIGASTDFEPPDLSEVVFSNQNVLSSSGNGWESAPSASRAQSVSQADREKLWPLFADDVHKLEKVLGRDLSAWDPTHEHVRWPDPPADLLEIHARVMAWVLGVVRSIEPTRYDDPTPCPDWNVHDLLLHMGNLLVVNLGSIDEDAAVALYQNVAAPDDPAHAFAAASAAHDQALQQSPRRRTSLLAPGARLPVQVQVALNLANQLAHGWDLAVATGQDATIPDDLAAPIGEFARRVLAAAPYLRAGYGEEVDTDDRAPAGDRFVAVLGRDPALAATVRPQ